MYNGYVQAALLAEIDMQSIADDDAIYKYAH